MRKLMTSWMTRVKQQEGGPVITRSGVPAFAPHIPEMPRRRACVFAGLAGLILLGASPNKGSPAERGSAPTTEAIAKKGNAEASNPTAPRADKGCKRGYDDRSSDLCAQWKAADAAYNSAWWTGATFFTALVGLVLGTVTMFAAIAAAKYAKRAAIATERTVDIAIESAAGASEALAVAEKNALAVTQSNEIALKAQRPWIGIEIINIGTIERDAEGKQSIGYDFMATNHGTVAAVVAGHHFGRTVLTNGDALDLAAFSTEAFRLLKFTNFSLAPGQQRRCQARVPFDDSPNEDKSLAQHWVGVAYQEPNAKRTFVTFGLVYVDTKDLRNNPRAGTFHPNHNYMKSIMT